MAVVELSYICINAHVLLLKTNKNSLPSAHKNDLNSKAIVHLFLVGSTFRF